MAHQVGQGLLDLPNLPCQHNISHHCTLTKNVPENLLTVLELPHLYSASCRCIPIETLRTRSEKSSIFVPPLDRVVIRMCLFRSLIFLLISTLTGKWVIRTQAIFKSRYLREFLIFLLEINCKIKVWFYCIHSARFRHFLSSLQNDVIIPTLA